MKQTRIYLLILAFFLLLNLATSGGHLMASDDIQYFLHTENLVLNNSIKLNPDLPSVKKLYVEDLLEKVIPRYYKNNNITNDNYIPVSVYDLAPLLLSFITIPFYYLATYTSQEPSNILGFFPNAIILSFTSLVIFATSVHYFKSQKISFVLSLIFLVTSFVWPYNTGMMLRPLAALFIISFIYFTITSDKTNVKKPLFAGIVLGLSLLSSASTAMILPILIFFGIVQFRTNKKQIIIFILGLVSLLLIQAELNLIRFGSFTEFGYSDFGHSNIDGLIGYIFSFGWGLPFNFPIIVFIPISLYLLFLSKNNEQRVFGITVALCLFTIWFYNGTIVTPHWSGYGGWGPRYFITIMPLLTISIGFVIKKFAQNKIFKTTFIMLALWGFFVSLMGKLIWYMYGYSYGWSKLKTHLMDDGWLQLNYNLFYAPISLHLQTLNSDYIQNMGNDPIGPRSWGLAPCPYDLFVYCEVGIIPFILIIIALTITGFLILNNLKIISLKKIVSFGKTR